MSKFANKYFFNVFPTFLENLSSTQPTIEVGRLVFFNELALKNWGYALYTFTERPN